MRKLFLTSFFILLLGLSTSLFAQTQSGSYFFNNSTAGFTLDKNEGLRSVEVEVSFNKPFDVKPKVVLSITVLDAVKDTKMRYSVEAKSVSRDGFVIKVAVWGDTQLTGIGGNWLAHVED